eukprot:1084555_1
MTPVGCMNTCNIENFSKNHMLIEYLDREQDSLGEKQLQGKELPLIDYFSHDQSKQKKNKRKRRKKNGFIEHERDRRTKDEEEEDGDIFVDIKSMSGRARATTTGFNDAYFNIPKWV